MNNVKFKAMVRPGDTIDLEVELVERMADAFFMNAKVTVGGKTAVTFDFACKMARDIEDNRTRRKCTLRPREALSSRIARSNIHIPLRVLRASVVIPTCLNDHAY